MNKLTGSKNRLLSGIAFLFTILVTANGCTKTMTNMYGTPTNGSKGTGGPETNEVWIQGMTFDPASITVTAGTTVTWTNKDAIAHRPTSNTGLFDSGNMSPNGTFSFNFPTAGTYNYFCAIHPSMTGKVIVY